MSLQFLGGFFATVYNPYSATCYILQPRLIFVENELAKI
jgi:hypothetical protein